MTKSSKESREHLSCFMDGELSRETGMFVMRRIGADAELQARWARYHLVRDCLRREGIEQAVEGLGQRVSDALDREPQVQAASASAPVRWLRPLASAALAATVAAVAIVVVQPDAATPTGAESGPATPAESFSPPNVSPVVPVTQPASYSSAQDADTAPLNSYVLRHNQLARSTGSQGFVSFVPIVATPDAEATETVDAEDPDAPLILLRQDTATQP